MVERVFAIRVETPPDAVKRLVPEKSTREAAPKDGFDALERT